VSSDKPVERFWLSEAQAAVLANELGPQASAFCMCGFTQVLIEGIGKFKEIQNSVRTGRGLKYDDYGEEMACAVCRDVAVCTRHFLLKKVRTIRGKAPPEYTCLNYALSSTLPEVGFHVACSAALRSHS
jgi:hypothetical protein